MDLSAKRHEKIKLVEINSHLMCYLCKGYLIDATTISECLHSFCRSCIIKFLQDNSHCPKCEVLINKAKPNIKRDKTLQDIVYKLVPELFINEMTRRQRFYQNHPEHAATATPEERGIDTERTIFNPSDVISLSIEYVSDDSTPGAILVPDYKGAPSKGPVEPDPAMMRRFLQCPALCRVDVLKKFVRNKYNVDTTLFYIDILYKRVPLPDHYTLIDIAYIFSWKRNEPMKFFFRITDINLVTERFDYLPTHPFPEVLPTMPKPPQSDKERSKKSTQASQGKENAKNDNNVDRKVKVEKKNDLVDKDLTEQLKKTVQNETTNDKKPVYTNITLNRSNNVEIITKIQKVSNKNGQPIGLNIIKQTVKKASTKEDKCEVKGEVVKPDVKTEAKVDLKPPNAPQKTPPSPPKSDPIQNQPSSSRSKTPPVNTSPVEIDEEKTKFLKSIELTSINNLQDLIESKKRKASPIKSEKPPKKPKASKSEKKPPKVSKIQNPAVRQIVTNVNQNQSSLNKIVEQTNHKQSTSKELQSLFDSCKINIPSSLSITLKNQSDEDGARQTPSSLKPVQNYIEILKLPEKDEDAKSSTSSLRAVRTKKQEQNEEQQKTPPNLPCKVSNMPKDNLIKLNPRSAQTFQKMFEEAIKKPEFNNKPLTATPKKEPQKNALDLSTNETPTGKRNILEIASQLYKKTKLAQEKNEGVPTGKVAIPRLNHQKKSPTNGIKYAHTLNNLHSQSLGMNYSVSIGINKNLENSPNKSGVVTSRSGLMSPLPKISSELNLFPEIKSSGESKASPESKGGLTTKSPNTKTVAEKTCETPLRVSPGKLSPGDGMGHNAPLKVSPGSRMSPLAKVPTTSSVMSPPAVSSAISSTLTTTNSATLCGGTTNVLSTPPNSVGGEKMLTSKLDDCSTSKMSPLSKTPSPIPKVSFNSPLTLSVPSTSSTSSSALGVKSPLSKTPLSLNKSPMPSPVPKVSPLSSPVAKEVEVASSSSGSTHKVSSSLKCSLSKSSPPNSTVVPTTASTSPLLSILNTNSTSQTKLPSPVPNQSSKSPKPIPQPAKSPQNVKPTQKPKQLTPNQILEKYNIQNLAQLTSGFNFAMPPTNQLAALQQAMILKHFEMQNRQNWLNMNATPLMQYEKYLQSLKQNKNHLLGNINEN